MRPPAVTQLPGRRLHLAAVEVELEHVAILFTDVVGSTELLDRLGDVAAHDLRRRHFALLRQLVAQHQGREVKSLGDGLMVAFPDAATAAACALAMQRAVAASDHALELRVGIAAGDAVLEDGDYFGRPVIVARRLCDAARGGEVVVPDAGPGLPVVDGLAHEVQSLGRLSLKGLREPVSAMMLRPRPLALSA
jgi:class 3 adenylate cyclase